MRSRNKLLTVIAGLALTFVLMVPALGQAEMVKKVDGWEILADLSGSMGSAWKQGECGKMSKFQAQKQLLQKVNEAIPPLDYSGAFRRFGHKFYIAGPEDYSRLEWGPERYDKAALAAALDKQKQTQGITPLGPATVASDAELSTWMGKKALVVFSDFIRSPDFGRPVDEATRLKEKYGDSLCIYTVNFSTATMDVSEGMAAASLCGKSYDGCTLLSDQNAFDQFIRDIFVAEGCVDSDGDGVCDDVDQCPNTPAGVQVDERGCWVVAYDAFFDFDKAVVKKEYYPNIEAAANVLKANPDLYVTFEGNTDWIGSEEYNYGLGLRRAKAVEKVMIQFGVQPGRMQVKSWGETKPIATNDTAEGRAKNRRVDIMIWEPK